MKDIDSWDIVWGGIRGVCEGKSIKTSRIMSRDGNIVTTKSGSIYRLLEPSKDSHLHSQEVRDSYWHGAKDVWECLDVQVKTNLCMKEDKDE